MTTKTTVTETVNEGAEPEVIEIDSIEEASETALDGLLAEFQGADNVTVNVYRQGEGRNMSFLFKTMPEEMTGGDIMERCRDKFGTGDYRMHVREGRRLVANRPFSVEAPKEVIPPTPRDSSGDIVALITAQMANQQQMFLGAMTAMAEAFKGGGNNQPSVDPVAMQSSVIQGIAAMKEIADSGKSTEPGGVELFIKALEVAKDMNKGGETNVADLGLKLVEALPMLQQAGQRQPMGPGPDLKRPMNPGPDPKHPMVPGRPDPAHRIQSTPQPPPPETSPSPSQSPPPDPSKNEAFLIQVHGSLQSLCRLAAEDKDPGIYAPMIVDQMGEEAIKEFIGREDALERMGAIEPAVKLYPGWFGHLKAAILEVIEENAHDEDPEEGDPLPNETETLTPEVVIARIDESGLRREGRQNAPITIPEPDTPNAIRDGGESDPSSDT